MRADEAKLRDAVGVNKIMWGSDYPHKEASFPFSREAIRLAFADCTPAEAAAILGGNAAAALRFRPRRARAARGTGRPEGRGGGASAHRRRGAARGGALPGVRRFHRRGRNPCLSILEAFSCERHPVDPYLIITSDSHAGLPTAAYRPYLESKYHARLRSVPRRARHRARGDDQPRRAQQRLRRLLVRRARRGAERRLGCAQTRSGARRRRHRRRDHLPGRRRGRIAYLRAIRHRARAVRRHRSRARHGGRPGAQPLARRAVPAQPRKALRRRAHPDHRRARRRARGDPAQQGIAASAR